MKAKATQGYHLRFYAIISNFNCNSLGGIWAVDEKSAITAFHAEMAPVVLDVYAIERSYMGTRF